MPPYQQGSSLVSPTPVPRAVYRPSGQENSQRPGLMTLRTLPNPMSPMGMMHDGLPSMHQPVSGPMAAYEMHPSNLGDTYFNPLFSQNYSLQGYQFGDHQDQDNGNLASSAGPEDDAEAETFSGYAVPDSETPQIFRSKTSRSVNNGITGTHRDSFSAWERKLTRLVDSD